jgi:hypothetical protein
MGVPSEAEVFQAHVWCDRWCERCLLSGRCPIGRQAAIQRSADADEPVGISKILDRALEMLEVECAKRGIDPRVLPDPPTPDRVDALVERATRWARTSQVWLATASPGEAEAVVRWYHTLVPAKLFRACSSRDLGDSDDARGSAKVASLGLGRVVRALTEHCQVRPADRPGLELLMEACSILQALEDAFPGHMSFRRPGLD